MSMQVMTRIHNVRIYVLALVASMGAVMFGYDLAFIGTAIASEAFEHDFHLEHATKAERDAFAANVISLLQAGCFFGALAAGPVSDRFGRKLGLMIAAVVFIIGSALQTWARGSKDLLYAGRAVGGLGVGAASGLVPLFVAESSPPAIRGRLVGIYEIGVQFGTLIGFWVNYGIEQHVRSGRLIYMIPFAIQLIPGGLLLIGMVLVPESPRWTALAKGKEATLDVLSRFRRLPKDHREIQEEAAFIIAQIEEELMTTRKAGLIGEFQELFGQSLNRRRILLGILMFIFMQFAGSNAINFYSPRIFASIGLRGSSTTLISTGIYGSVRFIAVCITMYFLVDKVGRTSLLMVGSAGMAVCMYYIGAFVQIHSQSSEDSMHPTPASVVAAVAIYVYAVFYCLSWAGIVWIYASEIYPSVIRSLAMSIVTATHWLFNFVIARSTPYMLSNIKGGTYFLFAACLTLSIPFVWFCLPETKGRRLEDMDILFVNAHRTTYGRIIGGEGSRQEVIGDSTLDKSYVATTETIEDTQRISPSVKR